MAQLDNATLAALNYYVVGHGTEGGDRPYLIGVTVRGTPYSYGRGATVAGGSGHAVGVMQKDLGQQSSELSVGLIAAAKAAGVSFSVTDDKVLDALTSKGGTIQWLRDSDIAALRQYTESAAGRAWIFTNFEKPQIDENSVSANTILALPALAGLSNTDSLIIGATASKIYNHSPVNWNRLRNFVTQSGSNPLSVDALRNWLESSTSLATAFHRTEAIKAMDIATSYVKLAQHEFLAPALQSYGAQMAAGTYNPGTTGTEPKAVLLELAFKSKWSADQLDRCLTEIAKPDAQARDAWGWRAINQDSMQSNHSAIFCSPKTNEVYFQDYFGAGHYLNMQTGEVATVGGGALLKLPASHPAASDGGGWYLNFEVPGIGAKFIKVGSADGIPVYDPVSGETLLAAVGGASQLAPDELLRATDADVVAALSEGWTTDVTLYREDGSVARVIAIDEEYVQGGTIADVTTVIDYANGVVDASYALWEDDGRSHARVELSAGAGMYALEFEGDDNRNLFLTDVFAPTGSEFVYVGQLVVALNQLGGTAFDVAGGLLDSADTENSARIRTVLDAYRSDAPANLSGLPTEDAYQQSVTNPSVASQSGSPDPTTAPNDQGAAVVGANYTVTTNEAVLNTNTDLASAAIGDTLTDGSRPGNVAVSYTGDAFDQVAANVGAQVIAASTAAANVAAAAASSVGPNTVFIPADPLILDLNGDGVRLTSYAERTVLFDIDHDEGAKEQTGWVAADTIGANPPAVNTDGIVVHDLDSNGRIDGIAETLSEYYTGEAGSGGNAGTRPYADGFAALASLDALAAGGNNDGFFSAADAAWANLRVWVDDDADGLSFKDTNANGILDAGEASELKTFAELGITGIDLSTTAQSGLVNGGNEVLATGTFTKDGQSQAAQAARFLANPNGHTFIDQQNGATTGTRIDTQGGAGTPGGTSSYVSHASAGEGMDAATLGVKNLYGAGGNDTLTGDAGANWLAGGLGSNTFNAGAGDDVLLVDAEDLQANMHAGSGTDIVQVIGEAGVTLNMAQAEVEIAQGGDGNDIFIGGGRSTVFVRAGAGDDLVIGGAANDALSGEDGADLIDGGAGNDLIRGHRGRDQLLGGVGDDILDGGMEDDQLSGGTGNDVLKGAQGDDLIEGGEGTDVAEFSGSFAEYRVVQAEEGYWISDTRTGRDGRDFLSGVEKLNFADVSGVAIEDEQCLITTMEVAPKWTFA